VLYAIARMGVAGTPRHVLEILAHLDRSAFTPLLYCLAARPEDRYLPLARALGVEILVADVGDSVRGVRGLVTAARLAATLRRRRVAVVHGYLFHGNAIGALAAALARVPVSLVSKRSLEVYPKRGERLIVRAANRLADRVTVNAEAMREHVHRVERCPLEKIVVIPNGIDFDRLPAAGPPRRLMRSPVIGTVGRLSEKKGHADLLAAVPHVLQRVPDANFVLVGDGPLRLALERQAAGLGVARNVTFLGEIPDGAGAMTTFDLFVLPSRVEGMSNALIEAMALGRPVVATAVGGNAEVVRDGEHGLIVPARDPASLAHGILTLLKDGERARAMGDAGRLRAMEQFSVRTMVERFEELYTERLAARGISA
jgi:glycosyltransferase involved in cell wall biosynthesis